MHPLKRTRAMVACDTRNPAILAPGLSSAAFMFSIGTLAVAVVMGIVVYAAYLEPQAEADAQVDAEAPLARGRKPKTKAQLAMDAQIAEGMKWLLTPNTQRLARFLLNWNVLVALAVFIMSMVVVGKCRDAGQDVVKDELAAALMSSFALLVELVWWGRWVIRKCM